MSNNQYKPPMCTIFFIDEHRYFNSQQITAMSDADYKIVYVTDPICNLQIKPDLVLYVSAKAQNADDSFNRLLKIFPQAIVFPFKDRTSAMTFSALYDRSEDLQVLAPARLVRSIQKYFEKPAVSESINAHTMVKGKDIASLKLFSEVDLIAPTNYHVMIFGETGTGKEVMARLIHERSARSNKPFVALDCGCLNKETALSELYGHVRGAFTDAVSEKVGAFEQANGGTLFLDEIGNLPYDVQVALLRSVQEFKIRKTGSAQELQLDLRIITATHESITQLVANGTFRQDLYYRLNEMSIQLPPLRARKADIEDLCNAFIVEACNNLQLPQKTVEEHALSALMAYSWPGNIRELKNVIKRTCLMLGNRKIIHLEDLPCEIQLRESDEAICVASFDEPCLKDTIQQAEYEQIMTALKKARYNKRKAASLLNIHRKTLYNKLKQMNIVIA